MGAKGNSRNLGWQSLAATNLSEGGNCPFLIRSEMSMSSHGSGGRFQIVPSSGGRSLHRFSMSAQEIS